MQRRSSGFNRIEADHARGNGAGGRGRARADAEPLGRPPDPARVRPPPYAAEVPVSPPGVSAGSTSTSGFWAGGATFFLIFVQW